MITTERDQFIGMHTTKDVKLALKEEAQRRGFSLSSYIDRILAKYVEAYLPHKKPETAA